MAKKKTGGSRASASPAKDRSAAASAGKGRAKAAAGAPSFPEALASLLRSRKLKVPRGLLDAPPDAYAHQEASFVEQLAGLPDAQLVERAEKVATYARRQSERARAAWESSPVVAELRRRKLAEPPPPARVVGAAFSLKTHPRDWSDAQLLAAAREWSRRANGGS